MAPVTRGMSPARQIRSQETLDRLLDATEALLDGRSFGEISVLEICETAEVSPSSFYSRFDSKDALLTHIHRRHLARNRARIDEAAAELVAADLDLEDLLRSAIRTYTWFHAASERFVQTLRIAELTHPHLLDERNALDSYGIGVVIDGLIERVGDPDRRTRRRIEFATRAVCAALQDAVHAPDAFAARLDMDLDELSREAATLWLAYVFAESPEGAVPDDGPDQEARRSS